MSCSSAIASIEPRDYRVVFLYKKKEGFLHPSFFFYHSSVNDFKVNSFCEITRVEFYPLSDREIEEYIATGEPFDKAGAYGIQGKGSVLVKRIEGDFFNVMGLPVARLKRELERMGALQPKGESV